MQLHDDGRRRGRRRQRDDRGRHLADGAHPRRGACPDARPEGVGRSRCAAPPPWCAGSPARRAAVVTRRGSRRCVRSTRPCASSPTCRRRRAVSASCAAGVATPWRRGRLRRRAAAAARGSGPGPAGSGATRLIVVVPPADALRPGGGRASASCWRPGRAVGAVLVAGDEAVLVANRLPAAIRRVPVIDQVDSAAAASCSLLAVEVRPPGHPLTTLADPVALGAAFGLGERDAGDAAAISRSLLDYSNAVVGLTPEATPARDAARDADPSPSAATRTWRRLHAWTSAAGLRRPRTASAGTAWAARSWSRALSPAEPPDAGSAATGLARLLGIPVTSPLTEPAAARLGAATTPGMLPGRAGRRHRVGHDRRDRGRRPEAVVAGAGELLTVAVARSPRRSARGGRLDQARPVRPARRRPAVRGRGRRPGVP